MLKNTAEMMEERLGDCSCAVCVAARAEYCSEPEAEYSELDTESEDEFKDNRPMRTGRHKGLLMANGRRKGLKNLWNSPRFDCWWVHSRMAAYHCHKDDKSWRRWQRDEMKTVRGVPDNDFNEWYDFVEGILQSVYQDSEILIEEGVC